MTRRLPNGPSDDTPPNSTDFLRANEEWVRSFSWGGLATQPRRHLAILTCMDSRYTAQGILGVQMGDAHVVRNAGGRVTDDAIRSLVLSAHVLGTRACVIVHHTKCGLFGTTNETIHERIRRATGIDASSIDFLPFDDLTASVQADVERLRACDLLPAGYRVFGFVYDVESGVITSTD